MAATPEIWIQKGDQVGPAPAEYIELVDSYDEWSAYGAPTSGRRISIMTLRKEFAVNEKIHVIHVAEALAPEVESYISGPKEVRGEYVDGKITTEFPPDSQDPLQPTEYNGRVVTGEYTDFHFVNTTYSFEQPGSHQITWKMGALESNILTIHVK